MGPIRRSGTRTNVHYDPEMPENWTLVRLRQELNTRGIRIPPNTRRMALVRLLRESRQNIRSDAGRDNEGHADTILGSARSQNSTATDTTTDHVHDAILGSAASQDASAETNNRTLINIVSRLSTTVQSLQHNVTTLTGQVNTLISQRTVDGREQRTVDAREQTTTTTTLTGNTWIPTFASSGNQLRSEEVNANGLNFNLETAYSALRSNSLPTAAAGSEEQAIRNNRFVQTPRGYSAESLPFVETVTPQLRRNIISDEEVSFTTTTGRSRTNTLPEAIPVNDELIHQVEELWEASLCQSTKQAYMTGVKCFQNFMVMNGKDCFLNALPFIDENCLIFFVAFCKNSLKLAHSTVKLYLAGIRHYFLKQGHSDPLANTVRLQCILRGLKKSQCNIRPKRMPITSTILKELCKLLRSGVFSPLIDLMLESAFNLAFFGFLRCGEFTCRSKDFSKDNIVSIQDISLDGSLKNLVFHLHSSKCDPFRQGVNITIFENNVFHPVATLSKYIKFRTNLGAKPQSPLFVNDAYDHTPLSRDRFISLLRNLLFRLGYKDDKFCGHSFRIGAATSAAAAGIEDHIIQTLGRWSSDCYIHYIRTNPKTIHAAQDKMCF
ncbi:uncharacterized protein LOC134706042 [Mytilus trossulus]|uniref:uncharacterized protein LOC134706042 n=1 Tax=Mytilus trossulus TaxID=6551 RepID=UPI00300761AE